MSQEHYCPRCKTIKDVSLFHSDATKKFGIRVQCKDCTNEAHRRKGESPEFRAWRKMKDRCQNPNNCSYKHYGGRGIMVCERWDHSFKTFLADMGPRPSRKHSLDRFPDVNGNYDPRNCRWATREEQGNNKRLSRFVEFDGRRQTISQWEKEIGVEQGIFGRRLRHGWSVEKTFFTPIRGRQHGA